MSDSPGAPTEQLAGSVERVTFHSEETGFCVLRVKVRGHRDLETIVGTTPSITPGEYVECTVFHDGMPIFTSYGKWLHPLFELEDYLADHPVSPASLVLQDKIIGKAAALLIQRLGVRTVTLAFSANWAKPYCNARESPIPMRNWWSGFAVRQKHCWLRWRSPKKPMLY